MSTNSQWGGPGARFRLAAQQRAFDMPDPEGRTGGALVNWQHPDKRRQLPVLEITLGVVGIACLLVMAWLAVADTALRNSAWAALLAAIPLVLVLATLLFLDRWEPEPPSLMLGAFLWGAGVAPLSSLFFNTSGEKFLLGVTNSENVAAITTAVFVAPVVEEFFKALGPLIIVLARRRQINSPIDAFIYAGIAAAGFAFVENILYFARFELATEVLVLRGVFSPFAHVIFTSCTGYALGIAVTRMKSRYAWVWVTPIGWCGAVLLHLIWNGTSSVSFGFFVLAYLLFQVPFFVTWLVVNIRSSIHQRRDIAAGLVPFIREGWFSPVEANMLTNRAARRAALRWARQQGQRPAMKRFQQAASRLALNRTTELRIGADAKTKAEDRELLLEAVEARRQFYGGQLPNTRIRAVPATPLAQMPTQYVAPMPVSSNPETPPNPFQYRG